LEKAVKDPVKPVDINSLKANALKRLKTFKKKEEYLAFSKIEVDAPSLMRNRTFMPASRKKLIPAVKVPVKVDDSLLLKKNTSIRMPQLEGSGMST